jgi:membrane-associated phospholipid phosphatase
LTIFQAQLAPSTCRLCASNGLDESVRDAVRWDRPKVAKGISDGLLVALPTGAIAGAFLLGDRTSLRRGFEDGLLVAESVSLTALGAQVAKLLAARERPFSLHDTGTYARDTDSHLSFFSGHTALTMAAVTSLATVERLRGNAAWPYLLAGGGALSLTTGYLRLGADKHWFTDVLTGAVWGAAVGLVVPRLHLGPTGGGRNENGVTLMATPFALMGTF